MPDADASSPDAVIEQVPGFLSALDEIEQLLHERLALLHIITKSESDPAADLIPYDRRYEFPDDPFCHVSTAAFDQLRGRDRQLAERIERYVQRLTFAQMLLARIRVAAHLLAVAAAQRELDPAPIYNMVIRWRRADIPAARVVVETLRSHALAEKSGNKPKTPKGNLGSDGSPIEVLTRLGADNHIRTAYTAYLYAQVYFNRVVTDREAFDFVRSEGWAKAHGLDATTFDAFTRYCSKARNLLGEQKHKRRAGREGRSLGRPGRIG